jgi:hypothetical protein
VFSLDWVRIESKNSWEYIDNNQDMYFGYRISASQGLRIAWMTKFLSAVTYIDVFLENISMISAEFEAERK